MKTAIDLSPFCEKLSTGSWWLEEPFVQDGFLMAIDSSIAVRVPSDEDDSSPLEGFKFPKLQHLFSDHFEKTRDWKSWPKKKWVPSKEVHQSISCPICDDTRKVGGEKCEHCEKMTGGDVCPNCKGEDWGYPCVQFIAGQAIAAKYDKLIREFGEARYTIINTQEWDDPKYKMVAFRVGNIQGLIAPIQDQ